MSAAEQLSISSTTAPARAQGAATWRISLPLVIALLSYAYVLTHAAAVLRDGDTFWHLAAGRWILEHGAVPTVDPFSSTMRGAPWTASEWLSEVLLALAQAAGGWNLVVALTGLAFAAATGALTRALLRWLEPLYALMFGAMAIGLTVPHVLARPHVLAMPLLVAWTAQLVRARAQERTPPLWMLPVMLVWANLHGGFTLGVALAAAFAVEAVWSAGPGRPRSAAAASWGLFLIGTVAAALLTPQGVRGFWFTWEVMARSPYALATIGEWRSPDFHMLQPLTVWLIGGLALVLYQGLRLPPVRIALVVGLVYLALKHIRNIELLGLLVPLVVAAPFAAQWRARRVGAAQWSRADAWLLRLAAPAGAGALAVTAALVTGLTFAGLHANPVRLPFASAPAAALDAARRAGLHGTVLNSYSWGGYLAYSGVPPFIDGRSDMYGDAFMHEWAQAMSLRTPQALERLLTRYAVRWTLLEPGTPAVALLDHLPGWRRVYADDVAVIHARVPENDK
jgi:hypothetical protein